MYDKYFGSVVQLVYLGYAIGFSCTGIDDNVFVQFWNLTYAFQGNQI